ncbi:ATP-dependent RecD-like DNA helicase [Candidatus Desulfarcum epimagneticum]|uniref:ATP-dependent RecD-like DNA helicase n=1 Tax=uncultured Desulfobacteraceae bacterium TaxID=218296 RepID=A0A484HLP1_9BACT|nr:ATP-dependent RecD-like DNA helicase [uncultured Desulfobacteraceae bacterium]
MPTIPFTSPSREAPVVESMKGIVERVTYHNPENGWSALRVSPLGEPHRLETVIIHQTRAFPGATMEFSGSWTTHPKFGRQFKASNAVEKKPATAAALEKYLGSGLIKGVGPKTAKKIVGHFKDRALDVFETDIKRLTEVPGIAEKKLAMISGAWAEHRAVRDVIMFLQSHGVSALFAVRVYREYRDDAVEIVSRDPYRLARDIYGIGFFSADQIALSLGFGEKSPERIAAAIRHVLSAARDRGHCYLTVSQTREEVRGLLRLEPGDTSTDERVLGLIDRMRETREIMTREKTLEDGAGALLCYARSLYFDERTVAEKILSMARARPVEQPDMARVEVWLEKHRRMTGVALSDEQTRALKKILGEKISVLTGGPGCGKTTLTRVLVRLLEAMGLKVLLAAPTGRAAQRMMDVIGKEAKTIHRLLEWKGAGFVRNEERPLEADFIVADECSMLDISLAACLLKAFPKNAQALLIGDADQLPSVGAGNVLKDIMASGVVPCHRLKKIFRQARQSLIVRHAHEINQGRIPKIDSPFENPGLWEQGDDCLFIDSDEATREQLAFIARVKKIAEQRREDTADGGADPYEFRIDDPASPWETEMTIPDKFRHVDLQELARAENGVRELCAVLKQVHPWSSLRYGLSAARTIVKLYVDWIPKYLGPGRETQVLTPMTRGSLGSVNLNRLLQESANPPGPGKKQLVFGDKILREGDRVIHRRNNYDLGVFNGDIGVIREVDPQNASCRVSFFPDSRQARYSRENLPELDLAYAITIHKSQGSEFDAVITPVFTQHFKMLFRNLIYTALTRGKKLAVLTGSRRALAMAVKNRDAAVRQTCLKSLLEKGESETPRE